MIKLISFDLQGTISDAAYSNRFWLEHLAEHKDFFKRIGVYDDRYYDDGYWTDSLKAIMKPYSPKLNEEFLAFIETITLPKIILSTTTTAFIELELGEKQKIFNKCLSTISDFKIAGKTPEVYEKTAKMFGVKPSEMLHIGDNMEMDIANALRAGCKAIHYQGNTKQTIGEIVWNMKS